MKPANFARNRTLFPLALACAMCVTASAASAADCNGADHARHLIYLPSGATSVDHAANVRALEESGFPVRVMPQAAESDTGYVLRVRDEVRALIGRGVAPAAITVLGSGRGSPATALVSVATGHRRVNYVMLGRCDLALTDHPHFRMSGRVLGLRDADDRASGSCRPLWRASSKVLQRRDLVVRTGLGAALFDAPHDIWLQPIVEWGGAGGPGCARVAARD